MEPQKFDRSSKWMLEEHGKAVLYLAGERSVRSCRARKAEVVQPRSLPDGLLEATFTGDRAPQHVLVEVATYPEKRVVEQVRDDIMLVRQARGVLPEALALVLCLRGRYRVPEQAEERSGRGWTVSTLKWKVVELWTLSAEELRAAPDVAVVLWASLARFDGPPEVLLQRCRDRIEREGGKQRANLLAVAQVFAGLHFDKPEWLEILGGQKAMIESPLIQELVEEAQRVRRAQDIAKVLTVRFGASSDNLRAGLTQIKDDTKLGRLLDHAAACSSLQEFEARLRDELPKPAPASTRGKRRSRKSST
jgi:predicted transposase YdaD